MTPKRRLTKAPDGMTGIRARANWNTDTIANPYRKALVLAIGKLIWPHIRSMSGFCGRCSSEVILTYANVGGYKAFKKRFGIDFVESKTVYFGPNTISSELVETIDHVLPRDEDMSYVASIDVTKPFNENETVRIANPYPPPPKYPRCRDEQDDGGELKHRNTNQRSDT